MGKDGFELNIFFLFQKIISDVFSDDRAREPKLRLNESPSSDLCNSTSFVDISIKFGQVTIKKRKKCKIAMLA